MGLIDTHCHLDAGEFDADRDRVVRDAAAAGVGIIVVPAIERANWDAVAALAACGDATAATAPAAPATASVAPAAASVVPAAAARGEFPAPWIVYALGIHPIRVDAADDADLPLLRERAERAIADPAFIGLGEIGLDHFVDGLDRERQRVFLDAQLRIARDLDLPVLLHVRRAVDQVTAALRRFRPVRGIAHAFNGSPQQADALLGLGLALGFGGAMTYPRALNLRRLATSLPDDAIVLETDAPDLTPEWAAGRRNEPAQLRGIAHAIAALRGVDDAHVAAFAAANARRVLPRLPATPGH